VAATAFVWRHLVALLAEREGVVGLAVLHEWLERPARRSPRCFPLPRERRLGLPDRPGVYRLLRAGGAVIYVGKAASLRQRVSGHFHAQVGERALEMLTQARDVACTETETALEAALLESDEIKRLAPPFNVALAAAGRAVWFATTDLASLRGAPTSGTPPGCDAADVRGACRVAAAPPTPRPRPRRPRPRPASRPAGARSAVLEAGSGVAVLHGRLARPRDAQAGARPGRDGARA
jgi:hypothetical protein